MNNSERMKAQYYAEDVAKSLHESVTLYDLDAFSSENRLGFARKDFEKLADIFGYEIKKKTGAVAHTKPVQWLAAAE